MASVRSTWWVATLPSEAMESNRPPGADGSVTLDRAIWFQVGKRVAMRPALWGTTVRQIVVLAAPGWWRQAPHLPVPPPEYVSFRMQTAYGPDGEPTADDVVTYLEWCRSIRRSARGKASNRR